MILTERDNGEYRIYAGAMEGPYGDGFISAVVVAHNPATWKRASEIFRDDALGCGHRWSTAESALRYALIKGREAAERARNIRSEQRAPITPASSIRRLVAKPSSDR